MCIPSRQGCNQALVEYRYSEMTVLAVIAKISEYGDV